MRSPKVSGANLPISSRWPGDSIWKQPRVCADWTSAKVAGSSRSRSSSSMRSPVVRSISSTAWAIDDCMRMPSTSSFSSPISSTSSLSNWLIGKPAALRSTGVRSSSVASDSSTPHGCRATCRGRPSSFSTRSRKVSSRPAAASRPNPEARSSGRSAQRVARIAGPDVREGLGEGVDLAGRHAEGGPDVADRVPHAVGVHHRDAGRALGAEPVEDPLVDLLAPRGLDVDVDVGQRPAQRRQEPLHQQAVPDRVDPGDAEQVVDQAAGARPAGGDPHPARLISSTTSATVRK